MMKRIIMWHRERLRKTGLIVLVALVFLLAGWGGFSLYQAITSDLPVLDGSPSTPSPEEEYVPGQIIVKFKPGTPSEAEDSLNERLGTTVIYTSPAGGFKILQIPEGNTVAGMVDIYSQQPIVEYAEQLAEIYQQKQALTPVQRKIDWSILRVIREAEERISAAHPGETPKFQDLSTPLLRIDDAGNIEVKLTVTSLSDERLEQLEALGMQIGLTLPEYGVIEGSLRYDQVEAVAGLDFVARVGIPGYPWHN